MSAGQVRRRRRADARRLDILRAAARVFRERGYAAAAMREIAAAADLSPANLYHYFRGKDEILFFCQDQSLDLMLERLAQLRRLRGPAQTRLKSLAIAHVLCLIDEVYGSAAHMEVDALPPALRGPIVAKRDAYERGVRRLVVAGVKGGELRRTDPTIATRAFLGALNWTAQWYRPEGTQTAQHVAEMVAEFAVSGLLSGEHARAATEPSNTPRRSAPQTRRASGGSGRRPALKSDRDYEP